VTPHGDRNGNDPPTNEGTRKREMSQAIYIASKTRHAERWKALRSEGLPINSTGRLYPDVCRRSAEQEWESSDARAALESTTTKGVEGT
jgi:hypothetical protein